jgi:hypothetical protein
MNKWGQSRFWASPGGAVSGLPGAGAAKIGFAGPVDAPDGRVRSASEKQENAYGSSPESGSQASQLTRGGSTGFWTAGYFSVILRARSFTNILRTAMQSFNPESFRTQQAQEIQAKLEQLQAETGQLMLELTTLYGKYATLLQENITLKSRMGKLELKEAVVTAR